MRMSVPRKAGVRRSGLPAMIRHERSEAGSEAKTGFFPDDEGAEGRSRSRGFDMPALIRTGPPLLV
jgi:hypothetical protein